MRISLINKKQHKKVFDILNYSLNDLIIHLNKTLPQGYTINDFGEELHIDHIIPKSLYKNISKNKKEFLKCWNLRNLRLLPARENIIKKDKVDYKLIEEYKIYDLLPNTLGG